MNVALKGLAFGRHQSGTVTNPGRRGRSEIPPRRLYSHCGGSVVRREAAINERRISMSKSAKKRSPAKSAAAAPSAKPSKRTAGDAKPKNANPGSKQARVIAMLQSP